MYRGVKKQLGEKLLQEAGYVLEEYYHQPLEEVITDLRIRCLIDKDVSDPVGLLHGLHFCGLFYQLKNEPAVHVRNAIARFVDGGFGLCLHCGDTIPQEWLMKSPLVEYCARCMVKVSPSHSGVSTVQDSYANTSR